MNALTLHVDNSLSVQIIPNQEHQFIMTTRQVAEGYGVTDRNIRMHITEHSDELLEGKHFVKGGSISSTLQGTNHQPHQTFWTKRGIVRLGFFIKSDRARRFRDWAEDLIIYNQENSIYDRIAALEERLNNTIVAPISLPTTQQLSENRTEFFKRWLRPGDMQRIAMNNGYHYGYVRRVKSGKQRSPNVEELLYKQCIENQNAELADNNKYSACNVERYPVIYQKSN